MKESYAVMGNPVAHSKSPFIHTMFGQQTGLDIDYQALLVEADFPLAVDKFFAEGGKGLNITVPYKEAACNKAEVLSVGAEMVGAVNTLMLDSEGRLTGHNTDGLGLVRDILVNNQGQVAGKKLLILGAGGASRGILLPLLQEGPTSITVANRTVAKAEELAGLFSNFGEIRGCGFDDLQGEHFDWVINATSSSLQGELPPLPQGLVTPDTGCYDLMYGKSGKLGEPSTLFCSWAKQQGARVAIDGLGMLVEQAAESFALWTAQRPTTENVMSALREAS